MFCIMICFIWQLLYLHWFITILSPTTNEACNYMIHSWCIVRSAWCQGIWPKSFPYNVFGIAECTSVEKLANLCLLGQALSSFWWKLPPQHYTLQPCSHTGGLQWLFATMVLEKCQVVCQRSLCFSFYTSLSSICFPCLSSSIFPSCCGSLQVFITFHTYCFSPFFNHWPHPFL